MPISLYSFYVFSKPMLIRFVQYNSQINVQERLYGKLNAGGCTVMEAPELLLAKAPAPPVAESPAAAQPTPVNCVQITNCVNSVSVSPSKAPTNKQIETRTSDGKRRITPMFIPPPPESTLVDDLILHR